MSSKVAIIEIFDSVQGEGQLVGQRQIFVRFPGCNMSCNYCDTQHLAPTAVTVTTLRGQSCQLPNPMSVAEVCNVLRKLNPTSANRVVALTGGEPLLHSAFLATLAAALRQQGFKLLLETNGTLYQQLPLVSDFIDYFSVDVKLPTDCGGQRWWREHKLFLGHLQALSQPVWVKLVLTPETSPDELKYALNLISSYSPKWEIFLQPERSSLLSGDGRTINNLLKLLDIAGQLSPNVRLLPQVHSILGIL